MITLIACFVLTACSNNTVTKTPVSTVVEIEQAPILTAVSTSVSPTPILTSTETKTVKVEQLEYTIVYEEGDFRIQQALLGSLEDWSWDNFSMPKSRIQNTVQDLGFDGACSTTAELQMSGWCTDTVKLTTTDGQEHQLDLACDHMLGGHCLLKRDGELIWEGGMNGGTCLPIASSRKIGDDVLIDYTSVATPGRKMVDSILLVKGNAVVDIVKTTSYDAAFAPYEITGKLLYFARKHLPDGKTLLVFDGREIDEYDTVFNQCCCWDGPPIQIHGNGEIVDFFVQKENGWYHVQAGKFMP
jgi:hypothetical protein